MKNTWRRFADYIFALWVPRHRVASRDFRSKSQRAIARAVLDALPAAGCGRCGSTPIFLGRCGSSLFWFRCAGCYLVWAHSEDGTLVSSSYNAIAIPAEEDPEFLMFEFGEGRPDSAPPS